MESNKEKSANRPHPREKANLFSIISFLWIIDLFCKGYKKDLELNDMYETLDAHSSSNLGQMLEMKWRLEMQEATKCQRKPKLLRALFKICGFQYLLCGVGLGISDIAYFYGLPICIEKLMFYFSNVDNKREHDQREAFLYASGIVFVSLVYCSVWHLYLDRIHNIGIGMRAAISSLMYKKVLELKEVTVGQVTNAGHIINILSNDVAGFDKLLPFINHLWLAPLGTIIITYFLWQEIGFSAFIGVTVLLSFIPLHGWLGKKMSKFKLKSVALTDRRVRLMTEIISGIEVIKMYVWEKLFAVLVNNSRSEEMKKIRILSFIRQTASSFTIFQWRVAFFCCILFFLLTGNSISARKVFITIAYFNMLRDTMTIYFPLGILQVAELKVSIKRIQSFLMLEEHDSPIYPNKFDHNKLKFQQKKYNDITSDIELKPESQPFLETNLQKSYHQYPSSVDSAYAICVKNLNAKWNEKASEICLNNITIDMKKKNLFAIIGRIGAGKSSLLQVFLEELVPISGSIEVWGMVSYASQEPWLFSGSIRQNILFGQLMNEKRYQQVIEICALSVDFENLPFGDKTIIGERGTMLSVGQKARVNLARCIYREADIYLLDDPLSSVDIHVGKHIFEKCIKGFLRNKTRILVTHQFKYLSDVDNVVFLEQGFISATGTYEELTKTCDNFTNLLESNKNEVVDESSNEESDLSSFILHRNSSADTIVQPLKNVETDNYPGRVEERMAKGIVKLNVYSAYFRSGGKWFYLLLVVSLFVLTQILVTGVDTWITYWVNLEKLDHLCNLNTSAREICLEGKDSVFYVSAQWRAPIFTILTGGTVIITILRTCTCVNMCYNASLKLHDLMFQGIIRSPLNFFNTNTSGRILNRFSQDVTAVDEHLPEIFKNILERILMLSGMILIIVSMNPYLLLPTLLIMIVFLKLYSFYVATSRDIKRIESVARSPIYSYFNTSLKGLSTIRAYGVQNILQEEFHRHVDVHSSVSYLFIACSRAFGLWADTVGILYIGIISFSFIFFSGDISEGNVGLAVTQTLSITGVLQWVLRQKSELENLMTAVERIKEYSELPPESNSESCFEKEPSSSWPENGEIIMENVHLKYNLEGQYILKNINLAIKPREKIGIIGRTGAGKSSLIAALFRLTPFDGKIKIDGVDINSMNLYSYRSKISVIPQEPILFSGTLRNNLDPFDEYTDSILWTALEEIHFMEVTNLPLGLNSKVSDDGSNFSVGQRQLICLARVIMRNNRILVLDEATANVDPQTDALIQTVIREKLKNCTILTIAHRLNTVTDSDKILVMDSGVCVEFDHTFNLLQNKNSIFYKMVSRTG